MMRGKPAAWREMYTLRGETVRLLVPPNRKRQRAAPVALRTADGAAPKQPANCLVHGRKPRLRDMAADWERPLWRLSRVRPSNAFVRPFRGLRA